MQLGNSLCQPLQLNINAEKQKLANKAKIIYATNVTTPVN